MKNSFISLLLLLSVAACKKPYITAEDRCKTTHFGYSVPTDTTYLLTPKCTFGTINTAAGSCTAIGTLRNTLSNNQGTFNTQNYCYYTLRVVNDSEQPLLYRISLDGQVTEYEGPVENKRYEGLLYRPLAGKLCAFERNLGTNDISLSELSPNGNRFTATKVVTAIPYSSPLSYIWSCVNRKTDEVFFSLSSGSESRIYALDTGKRPKLFYDSPGATLSGLSINSDDSMLYCIEKDSATSRLVKITPNGTRHLVTMLPDSIIESCVSTSLGRCNNEYIISSKTRGAFGYFFRIDILTGATHKLSTPYVILGLVASD